MNLLKKFEKSNTYQYTSHVQPGVFFLMHSYSSFKDSFAVLLPARTASKYLWVNLSTSVASCSQGSMAIFQWGKKAWHPCVRSFDTSTQPRCLQFFVHFLPCYVPDLSRHRTGLRQGQSVQKTQTRHRSLLGDSSSTSNRHG